MSLERAKKYLEEKGYADHVIELEESSATVQLAAEALGVEQGMIAKTMSFLVDGEPILILTEGTAKVDNRKYKDQFHVKAKMIPFDEVEEYIGHAPGGVCPFGINEGVDVYLDESYDVAHDKVSQFVRIHGITKKDVDSYIREFPIAIFKYYYELRLDDVFA